jgi:hypothetical protein
MNDHQSLDILENEHGDRRTKINSRHGQDHRKRHGPEQEQEEHSWKDTVTKYLPTALLIGTWAYMLYNKK